MHGVFAPYLRQPGDPGERRPDGEARPRALAEPAGARRRSVLQPRRRGARRHAFAPQGRVDGDLAVHSDCRGKAGAGDLARDLSLGAPAARLAARAGAAHRLKINAEIVGRETGPDEQNIDARWLMAYSAGLGEREFPHPLFPVCYEWPATRQLRERAGLVPIDARLVHAQHDLIIHRPPKEEALFISGKIVAALQRKPGVLVVYRFITRDERKELVSTTDFSALYRDAKLEGGDRVSDKVEDPPKHSQALKDIGDISVA